MSLRRGAAGAAVVMLIALVVLEAVGVREAPAAGPPAHRITFVNRTHETIWIAAASSTGGGGWRLPAGRSRSVTVSARWNGRFWGRTGCHFSRRGLGRCETGDCGGRFVCRGSGRVPATLAEFNMNASHGLDFYDVSLVDGSNLPMWINIARGRTHDPISADGCSRRGCTSTVRCPSILRDQVGGRLVGCYSACAHFGTDRYCCRGPYGSSATCNPRHWPVNYAAPFKRAEPFAYSYALDDATSTFTCAGSCDYRLTFGTSARRARRSRN